VHTMGRFVLGAATAVVLAVAGSAHAAIDGRTESVLALFRLVDADRGRVEGWLRWFDETDLGAPQLAEKRIGVRKIKENGQIIGYETRISGKLLAEFLGGKRRYVDAGSITDQEIEELIADFAGIESVQKVTRTKKGRNVLKKLVIRFTRDAFDAAESPFFAFDYLVNRRIGNQDEVVSIDAWGEVASPSGSTPSS